MRLFNFFVSDGTTQSIPPDVTIVSGVLKSTGPAKNIKNGGNFVTLANILLDYDSTFSYGNMNSFTSSSVNNNTVLAFTGSFSSNDEVISGGNLMNGRAHIIFIAETDHRG